MKMSYKTVLYTLLGFIIFRSGIVISNESGVIQWNENKIHLKNIDIEMFVDVYKYIRWNVTTTKDEAYSIKVEVEMGDHPCSAFIAADIPINTSLIFPIIEFAAEKLELGCTYRISVHNKSDEEIEKAKIVIPKCLLSECNCDFKELHSDLTIDSVERIDDEKYEVVWKTPNNSLDKNYIELLQFQVESLDHSDVSVISLNNTENKALFQIHNLAPGETYNFTLYFNNKNHCEDIKHLQFTVAKKSNLFNFVAIIIVVGVCVLLLLCISLTYRKKLVKYLKQCSHTQESLYLEPLVTCTTNPIANQVKNELYPELKTEYADCFEIPPHKIIFEKQIGKGAFGLVYSARMKEIEGSAYTMIAVKSLKDSATEDEQEDFKKEISMLKKIDSHPNIVRLYGYCTLSTPYLIVMELVPCGDLKRYLLELREQWKIKKRSIVNRLNGSIVESEDGDYIEPNTPITPNSPNSYKQLSNKFQFVGTNLHSTTETLITHLDSDSEPRTPQMIEFQYALEKILDNKELQDFASQIASGMEHLEKIEVTHRDLAARNILINQFRTLKISDFGLSRLGPYVNSKSAKLPLRWMAVESIQHRRYSNKTDVWSFSVVLWEIATLGGFPYESVPDSLVLHHLLEGKRLPRPEICTDEMFSLMLTCWENNPDDRPCFNELTKLLHFNKNKAYVDFNQLSPSYAFPPAELDEIPTT